MANPNPSPSTRIGAASGPKPGKTTEAARLEVLNAEAAMRIRARILEALERKLNPQDLAQDEVDSVVLAMMDKNMLTMIRDSETRGLGAPVQKIIGDADNPLKMITEIRRVIVRPSDDNT